MSACSFAAILQPQPLHSSFFSLKKRKIQLFESEVEQKKAEIRELEEQKAELQKEKQKQQATQQATQQVCMYVVLHTRTKCVRARVPSQTIHDRL